MRMRAMKETECKKVVIEAKKGWIKQEQYGKRVQIFSYKMGKKI